MTSARATTGEFAALSDEALDRMLEALRREHRTRGANLPSLVLRLALEPDRRERLRLFIEIGRVAEHEENRTWLAATRAAMRAAMKTERAQRKDASVKAAAESAEQRAKASAEHWTNEWFAKAHDEHPDYGRVLLARYARVLAAADNIEKKERAKITASRAQQFLDRLRNATKSGRNATQSGC